MIKNLEVSDFPERHFVYRDEYEEVPATKNTEVLMDKINEIIDFLNSQEKTSLPCCMCGVSCSHTGSHYYCNKHR